MKRVLCFLVLLASLNSLSQESLCFDSKKEVETTIIGYWKQKEVPSNIIYQFKLDDDLIELNILEDIDYIENAQNNLVFPQDEKIEINKSGKCFEIGILIKRKYGSVYDSFEFISKDEFRYFNKIFARTSLSSK